MIVSMVVPLAFPSTPGSSPLRCSTIASRVLSALDQQRGRPRSGLANNLGRNVWTTDDQDWAYPATRLAGFAVSWAYGAVIWRWKPRREWLPKRNHVPNRRLESPKGAVFSGRLTARGVFERADLTSDSVLKLLRRTPSLPLVRSLPRVRSGGAPLGPSAFVYGYATTIDVSDLNIRLRRFGEPQGWRAVVCSTEFWTLGWKARLQRLAYL